MKAVISKSKAHASTIRCLDFAKGDSQHLASCGSDCKVKVWDTRQVSFYISSLNINAGSFRVLVRAVLQSNAKAVNHLSLSAMAFPDRYRRRCEL